MSVHKHCATSSRADECGHASYDDEYKCTQMRVFTGILNSLVASCFQVRESYGNIHSTVNKDEREDQHRLSEDHEGVHEAHDTTGFH